MNSSLPLGLKEGLFLGAFNSICWGSILLATAGYRHPNSAIFPIVIGFAWPTLFYLTFDGKSSPLGIIFFRSKTWSLFLPDGWQGVTLTRKASPEQTPDAAYPACSLVCRDCSHS